MGRVSELSDLGRLIVTNAIPVGSRFSSMRFSGDDWWRAILVGNTAAFREKWNWFLDWIRLDWGGIG